MKSNTGINNVNRETIMNLLPQCGHLLATLFNQSFESGMFPDVLKYTVVVPIPKVKGSNRAEEMRPVNTACTIDKLLQTIVKIQLQEHIDRCNILYTYQSAYRQYHSCETALNLLLIDWKEAKERKKVIVAVFLDFKRAFETVNRKILYMILQKYGVTGTALQWFRSWLTNRKQFTRYGDRISGERRNEFGVPQGTPLSCIMFLLYINSIACVLKHCKISMFADDTLVWIEANTVDEAIRLMNEDLSRISVFLKMLKLKLNTQKTKAMLFNARQVGDDIRIDGEVIEKVQLIKYLGVMIDSYLSFAENINYISKKVAKKVALIGRLKKKTDRDTRLTLLKTLITPHFDFCSSILLLANEMQFHQLQLLMNKALRIIENADRRTHIHNMLESTDLLDVKQRVCYNVLMLIYRVQNRLLPEYICRHFHQLCEVQPYHLRNNKLLRTPTYTTSNSQNSFKYRGAKMYNDMVQRSRIDASASELIYRNAIKKYVKDNVTAHRVIQE